MQYSSVDGKKFPPFPKGRGICSVCDSETIAKCGEKVMWHWAHKSKMDCDPWWENETEWHRNWKEHFPENFREIVHLCGVTGEKHRADIKSDKGIILEIQNSPISLEELRAREDFYKNMVWIVNGEKFRSRFKIWRAPLPDPEHSGFEDIIFIQTKYESSCTMFMRKSGKWPMAQVFPTREIAKKIHNAYRGHHSFHWTRPHIAWTEAKCPVFLDFGTEILWKIENYRDQFNCVRAMTKEEVIFGISNNEHVQDIGNGYTLIDSNRKRAK